MVIRFLGFSTGDVEMEGHELDGFTIEELGDALVEMLKGDRGGREVLVKGIATLASQSPYLREALLTWIRQKHHHIGVAGRVGFGRESKPF